MSTELNKKLSVSNNPETPVEYECACGCCGYQALANIPKKCRCGKLFKIHLEQLIQHSIECANIIMLDQYDSNRVFCKKANDWVYTVNCNCSQQTRQTECSGEW